MVVWLLFQLASLFPVASGSSAAPTVAPTAVVSANYNGGLAGAFCTSSGLTLDGIDDSLTLSPAVAPWYNHTIVARLLYSNNAADQRLMDFGETTACSGDHYYILADTNNKLKIHLDGGCGSLQINDYW